MKAYVNVLKYELKTMLKDPMSIFLLLYPFIMLFFAGYLIPMILKQVSTPTSQASALTMLIAFIVLLSAGGFVTGGLLGFSFLDNRDENTFLAIAVSPLSIRGYTIFKTLYTFVISFIGNVVMLGGLVLFAQEAYTITYQTITIGLLANLTVWHVLSFSFVASMVVPFVAMIIVVIAKNKIEGFAFLKASGLFIMIPALMLLDVFQDGKQYILGVIPTFWPTKALLNVALGTSHPQDLTYFWYLLIGTIYPLVLSGLAFMIFDRKVLEK